MRVPEIPIIPVHVNYSHGVAEVEHKQLQLRGLPCLFHTSNNVFVILSTASGHHHNGSGSGNPGRNCILLIIL